jgi:hypothetical protein
VDVLAVPVSQLAQYTSLYTNRTIVDSSKSSTFKTVGQSTFSITYGDKTGSKGDFITDNFGIGGATIQNQIMGLAKKTTTGSGLIGIGYSINEAIVQSGNSKTPYPSIMDTLVAQNLISTKTYSLYLNSYSSNSGSIIFGGADTGKFM